MAKKILTFVLLLACNISLKSQSKSLSLKNIFDTEFLKPLTKAVEWFEDGNSFLVEEGGKILRIDASRGDTSLYFDYSYWQKQLPEGFKLSRAVNRSKDYKYFVLEKDKDLYYFSVESEELLRMTNDTLKENNPRLSPDGRFVAYTKAHNLYVYDTENEEEKQLTFDGSELVYNGWSSWVYDEEIIGRSSRHLAFWWSPDSKKIAFLWFDDSPVPEYPIFHAVGVHGFLEKTRYPYAGDPDPKVKLGVVDVNHGKIVWADFDYSKDQYIAWPFWLPDGKALTVQWMNRKQDTLKIFSVNVENGKLTEIYSEHQNSWVEWFTDLKILKNGRGMIIRSNKSGYAHLYFYGMDGNLKKRITQGKWEVKRIDFVDEKNGTIYFEGWQKESTENHLFKVNFNGSGLIRLTEKAGTHSCNVSPNGKYFLDRFSNINTPPRLLLCDSEGKTLRMLGGSKSDILEKYDLPKVELFRFTTSDGWRLPVKWFLPTNFDKNKKYPVLISIYGGPNAATVHNSFPHWLLNYFLASNGIIVVQVDHRGSGHFGKQGVALMHRHLGKWEMHDYIEAVKWLSKKTFVDTNKIAISGGSYGGYVTCMAMTYGADYFDYGIAQYSVTDWRLYDNVYTERYMDMPAENPEGYKESSVFTYVDKYKGGLLITHGTIDDNVHFQNTLGLVNKLEELNKNFEMMIYPGERHGIRYKFMHSLKLELKFLFKNLLGKDFTDLD